MQNFGIHFMLSNFILAGLTGFILAVRRLLRGRVSPQIQYRLWFLWLAFLFVPFLPVDLSGFSFRELICDSVSQVGEGTAALTEKASGAFSISGDYAVSVSSGSAALSRGGDPPCAPSVPALPLLSPERCS